MCILRMSEEKYNLDHTQTIDIKIHLIFINNLKMLLNLKYLTIYAEI
jgi:hypothetical protein